MYYNMEEGLNKKLKYLSWFQIDKTCNIVDFGMKLK
jgi:hypothetical protein